MQEIGLKIQQKCPQTTSNRLVTGNIDLETSRSTNTPLKTPRNVRNILKKWPTMPKIGYITDLNSQHSSHIIPKKGQNLLKITKKFPKMSEKCPKMIDDHLASLINGQNITKNTTKWPKSPSKHKKMQKNTHKNGKK